MNAAGEILPTPVAGDSGASVGGPSPDRLPQLEDLPDVAGKRVLVRCDFNVALRRGKVVNDLRIRAATPTLQWLVRREASVTVCTHLGRPGGRVDPRLSVEPVRRVLRELVPDVRLLENLRFSMGEEANDAAFVDTLVAGHDLFVNDAFATSHRRHASVLGPPTRLRSAAGRLLSREVEVITALRGPARRPLVAVIGGQPRPELSATIESLSRFADTVIVGGAVAFEAMDARAALAGRPRDPSWSRSAGLSPAPWSDLMSSGRVVLPVDVVTTASSRSERVSTFASVTSGSRPVDIGHRSAIRFAEIISRAGTVFWDGPMGPPGDDRFPAGTRAVAEAVASSPAFTVVSGSETVEALDRLGLTTFVDHVSTGGAATLELMREEDLPGIRALRESATRTVPDG